MFFLLTLVNLLINIKVMVKLREVINMDQVLGAQAEKICGDRRECADQNFHCDQQLFWLSKCIMSSSNIEKKHKPSWKIK